MAWLERLNDIEYRNWLKVGLALSIMCDGIRTFIDNGLQTFYLRLQHMAGAGTRCNCAQAPRRHDVNRCKWARAIVNHHRDPRNIIWRQTDSTQWDDPITGPWEVGKAYMRDLGGLRHAAIDAEAIDASSLLNLLHCCTHYPVEVPRVEAVKDVRNIGWCHAPHQKISNEDTTDCLDAIEHLLQDPSLVNEPPVLDALNEIQQIENLEVVSLQRAEVELLTRYLDMLVDERDEFKARVDDLQDGVNEVKEILRRRQGEANEAGHLQLVSWVFRWFCTFLFDVVTLGTKMPPSFYRRLLWMFCLLAFFQILGQGVYKEECGFRLEDDNFFPSLKEFDFTARLSLSRKHFTGRQWVFQELEGIIQSERNIAGVVIQGPPGSGKSALAAQLICSKTSSLGIHRSILGYHVCTYSNATTQSAAMFVRNLARMVASRVPEYQRILRDKNSKVKDKLDKLCNHDTTACLLEAFIQPLKTSFNPGLSAKRFIVIDGLDECFPVEKPRSSEIVLLLNGVLHEFPKWLKLVLTSRALPIAQQVSSRPIFQFDLQPNDSRTLQDIDSYVTRVLYRHYSRSFSFHLKWLFGFSESKQFLTVVDKLVERSEGNFMFVKAVLQLLLADTEDITNSRVYLPSSLTDAYKKYFERAFPVEEKFEDVRGILEILIYSTEPLTKFEVYEVLRGQQSDLEYEYGFLQKFNKLSHFLLYGEANDTVAIYHKTVSDWLKSNGNEGSTFFVSPKRACKMLADYYLKRNATLDKKKAFTLAKLISCGGMDAGEVELFHSLASATSDWTYPSHRGRTLLHKAAQLETPNIAYLLTPFFTNVDEEDEAGFTPAFLSVISGQVQTLEMLYNLGANISHKSHPCRIIVIGKGKIQSRKVTPEMSLPEQDIGRIRRTHCSSTMLHVASALGNEEIVSFLIEKGVDINSTNAFQETSLQLAAQFGRLEIVTSLHISGAKMDNDILKRATVGNSLEVVDYLLRTGLRDDCSSNVRSRNRNFLMYDNTALHLAAIKGHTEVANILLATKQPSLFCVNYFGYSVLHYAVFSANPELVELIMKSGLRPDVLCSYPSVVSGTKLKEMKLVKAETYLTEECPCGFTALHFTAKLGFVNVATALLNGGASVNKEDCFGSTPLHLAACANKLHMCQALKDKGANVHARSLNGSTPFHSAAVCGAVNVFDELQIWEPHVEDYNGLSVLHYAVKDVQVRRPYEKHASYKDNMFLLSFSLNDNGIVTNTLNLTWLYSLSNLIIRMPKDRLPDIVDKEGKTLLHYMAERGLYEGIKLLEASGGISGSLLVKRDISGNTALDSAIFSLDQYRSANIPSAMMQYEYEDSMSGDYGTFIVHILISYNRTENQYKEQLCFLFNQTYRQLVSSKQVKARYFLLIIVFSLCCWKSETSSPLLSYLNAPGGDIFNYVILYSGETVNIRCGESFNESNLHLFAYRTYDFIMFYWKLEYEVLRYKDVDPDEGIWRRTYHPINMFYKIGEKGSGPLARSLDSIEHRSTFIDRCKDTEGYNALQRAAQGSNVAALQMFVSWGARTDILSPEGHDLIHLVVLYSVKTYVAGRKQHSLPKTFLRNLRDDMRLASKAAEFLLWKGSSIACNRELTLYHFAASRGMAHFILDLFRTVLFSPFDTICEDKNFITPLYLAHLYGDIPSNYISYDSHSVWVETILSIKHLGAVRLTYPRRDAELILIYYYLYGHFQEPFRLDLADDILRITAPSLLHTTCVGYSTSRVNFDDYYAMIRFSLHRITKKMFHAALWNPIKSFSLYTVIRQAARAYLDAATEYNKTWRATKSLPWRSLQESRLYALMTEAQMVLGNRICIFLSSHHDALHKEISMMLWNLTLEMKSHLTADCVLFASYESYINNAFAAYVNAQIPKVKVHGSTWPPKDLKFVRERMGWIHDRDLHSWPLEVLIRIALNDTADFDYLKTLNVGLLTDLIEIPT